MKELKCDGMTISMQLVAQLQVNNILERSRIHFACVSHLDIGQSRLFNTEQTVTLPQLSHFVHG